MSCATGFREVTRGIKPGDWVSPQGMQKVRLGNKPLTEEEKAKGVKPKPNLVRAEPFDRRQGFDRSPRGQAGQRSRCRRAPAAADRRATSLRAGLRLARLNERPPRGSPGKSETASRSGRLGR